MGLLISTCIIWLITVIVYHNLWFVVLMTINTAMVLGRLKGILFRFKTMVIWEVLAFAVPVIFSLVFKRFDLTKYATVLVLRVIFMLIVKYDMSQYVYPHKLIKEEDDEEYL